MDNERKEHRFFWYIENYSFCWHKNGYRLVSPKFTARGFEDTAWHLILFPRGGRKEHKRYISLYLNRNEEDSGPKQVSIKFELSLLIADGSTLCSAEHKCVFIKGGGYGSSELIQIDKVLLRRKTDYLSQDTLTVCCKMWQNEGIHSTDLSFGRTRIGIEKISFLRTVKNFTELEKNQKNTVNIKSPSNEECDISSIIYVADSCCEGKIIVETISSAKNHFLSEQTVYLLDGSQNLIKCGEIDNRFDVEQKDYRKLVLSIKSQFILSQKNEYLRNDELSLLCECTFSTGIELNKIEEMKLEYPTLALSQTGKNENIKKNCYISEKLSTFTSASEDMKAMYVNQCFTDTELKTKTKTFSVHKIVLCARSAVFRAILTNDMKEKSTHSIQIDDLENETIQHLLLFLYSDELVNLTWESAVKLYYAGDKYDIGKLKVLCASFLIDNLSTTTAGELLLLAETHNDSDLKTVVENFILEHEEEVFGSDEWENLIEINPQLVLKTMHLKYKRKKKDSK